MSEFNEIRDQIIAISAEWAEAIVANDADAIGKFMLDDWIMVSERGVTTKEHFLSFVRSGQLTHSSMEMAEFGEFRLLGDTAVIMARVTNTAQFGGQTFEADEWTSDVFVRTADDWKCAVTHITPVLTRRD